MWTNSDSTFSKPSLNPSYTRVFSLDRIESIVAKKEGAFAFEVRTNYVYAFLQNWIKHRYPRLSCTLLSGALRVPEIIKHIHYWLVFQNCFVQRHHYFEVYKLYKHLLRRIDNRVVISSIFFKSLYLSSE